VDEPRVMAPADPSYRLLVVSRVSCRKSYACRAVSAISARVQFGRKTARHRLRGAAFEGASSLDEATRCPHGSRSGRLAAFLLVTGLVETIWLFVRGEESVRVIRAATPEGRARLLVYGPGNTQETHEFEDGSSCTARQSELERELVAVGFTREQFTAPLSGGEPRSV